MGIFLSLIDPLRSLKKENKLFNDKWTESLDINKYTFFAKCSRSN